jgi:hypothetical protein
MAAVDEEDLDCWQAPIAPYVARNQRFRSRFLIDGLKAWIRGIGESNFAQGAIKPGLSVSEGGQAGMIQGLHLRFRLNLGGYRQ